MLPAFVDIMSKNILLESVFVQQQNSNPLTGMSCSDFEKLLTDGAWENDQFAPLHSTEQEAFIQKTQEILERNIDSKPISDKPEKCLSVKTNAESLISLWQNENSLLSPSESNKQMDSISAFPQFMDPNIFAMISPSFLSGSLSPIECTDINSQLTTGSFSVWSPSPFRNMLSPPPILSSFEPLLSPFSSFAGSLSPISTDQSGCLPSGETWGQNSNLTKFSHALVDFENLISKTWESNLDYECEAKEACKVNIPGSSAAGNPLLNLNDLIRLSKPVPQPVLLADVNSKLLETQSFLAKDTSLLEFSGRSNSGFHFRSNNSTNVDMSQVRQQPRPIRPGLAFVNNMCGSLPLASQKDGCLISKAAPTALSLLPTTPHDGKKGICNCKKSKCLKLYCECFSSGKYCTSCNCADCHNLPFAESQRQEVIKSILERNPKAFGSKINRSFPQQEREHHLSGCNCKKSSCLKKYCECYQAGVPCSTRCKCVQCLNGLQGTSQAHPLPGNARGKISPDREIAPSGIKGILNRNRDPVFPSSNFAPGSRSLSPAPATDPPVNDFVGSGLASMIPARIFQDQMSTLTNPTPLFLPNQVWEHLKKRQRVTDRNQPCIENWTLPTTDHCFHHIGSPSANQSNVDGKRAEYSNREEIGNQADGSQHISLGEKEVIKREASSLPLKKMMLINSSLFLPQPKGHTYSN